MLKNQTICMSEELLRKKIKNRNRLLNYLKWLVQFVALMDVYPYLINQHQSSVQSYSIHIADSILRIVSDTPRCVWPHPYECSESNRFIYAKPQAKNQLHTSPHSLDIANSFFWITLGMLDYPYLKRLNKLVTSMNVWPHAKSQLLNSIHSWDYSNTLFDITLGKPCRSCPQVVNMI